MIDIEENLAAVRERIAETSRKKFDNQPPVTLVAVSKTRSSEEILAAIEAGQMDFGENYLQEAVAKIDEIRRNNVNWHFIGSIQANKTAVIASYFHWVHSVDRLKIAQRLAAQRPAGMPPLNICLQVNIDAETSKSGVATDELRSLVEQVALLPQIRLRGLMAIPRPGDSASATQAKFANLRELLLEGREWLQALATKHAGVKPSDFDTLSMGMSADLELALAEGATMVRVGTDIFGPRPAR